MLFIWCGNRCFPGDESSANTRLISKFLRPLQIRDRDRPELLSVNPPPVTTSCPSSPRRATPSEVGPALFSSHTETKLLKHEGAIAQEMGYSWMSCILALDSHQLSNSCKTNWFRTRQQHQLSDSRTRQYKSAGKFFCVRSVIPLET